MEITKKEIIGNAFKPYELIIKVNSKMEHDMLKEISYLDGTIPENIPLEYRSLSEKFLSDLYIFLLK